MLDIDKAREFLIQCEAKIKDAELQVAKNESTLDLLLEENATISSKMQELGVTRDTIDDEILKQEKLITTLQRAIQSALDEVILNA